MIAFILERLARAEMRLEDLLMRCAWLEQRVRNAEEEVRRLRGL